MHWTNYLAAFFAGAFLANFVPHFVKGICGDPFPTPFATPPGKGLSSPTINVLWALLNLLIAAFLIHAAHLLTLETPLLLTAFAGFAALSLPTSHHFQSKHAS